MSDFELILTLSGTLEPIIPSFPPSIELCESSSPELGDFERTQGNNAYGGACIIS